MNEIEESKLIEIVYKLAQKGEVSVIHISNSKYTIIIVKIGTISMSTLDLLKEYDPKISCNNNILTIKTCPIVINRGVNKGEYNDE